MIGGLIFIYVCCNSKENGNPFVARISLPFPGDYYAVNFLKLVFERILLPLSTYIAGYLKPQLHANMFCDYSNFFRCMYKKLHRIRQDSKNATLKRVPLSTVQVV